MPAVHQSHNKPDPGAMAFVWLIRCLSQSRDWNTAQLPKEINN